MPEEAYGSVTQIVISLRGGDRAQVTPLWERYFDRLTHHAAKYLRYAKRSDYSDEDAALSAIDAFFDGLAEGKFADVDRREKLWGLLARITERKVLQRLRGKRFDREIKFSDLQGGASEAGDGVCRIAAIEPSVEYREILRMEIDELIEKLPNPLWREAARLAMEGYTVPEIAAKLDRSRACVYVWFRAIEAIWEEHPGRAHLLE